MSIPGINCWVKVKVVKNHPGIGTWWPEVEFYDSKEATEPLPTGGLIKVGREGAVIRFYQKDDYQKGDENSWFFHNFVLHPMGEATDELDISWKIERTSITVLHARTEEGPEERKYSYTLAFQRGSAGTKFFFDPQLVDEPGGPGG